MSAPSASPLPPAAPPRLSHRRPPSDAGPPRLPRRALTRRTAVVVVAALLLVVGVLASLAFGTLTVPLRDVLGALTGASGTDDVSREVVLGLRLPRTVVAAVVGAALGTAGAVLQGALGNPLAAPDVIGVTAGSGLGAMLVILVFPASITLLPTAALAGGLIASAIVFAVAWTGPNRGGIARIILAGIAISSLFTAATAALLATHPDQASSGVFFLAGNLSFDGWTTLEASWPYLAVGGILAVGLIRPLDRQALGDDVVRSLGGRPGLIRLLAASSAAVLAAAAAAMAGLLGFLGLIVPHVVRLAGGTGSNAFIVPVSALVGAALLVVGDVLARTVAPMELPVGPLVVAVGVPLFLWLLQREL